MSTLAAALVASAALPLLAAGDPRAGALADGGAATYYVAPGGDDAADGSASSPWATPGFGSRQLAPGDTLVIRSGRYTLTAYDGDVLTPPSGLPGRPVCIRGEEGGRPVLAMRNTASSGSEAGLFTAIELSGAHDVRIENLEITHDDTGTGSEVFARQGVNAAGRPAKRIELRDLWIHHLDEAGINLQDIDGLEMTGCRIEYCGVFGVGGPRSKKGWRNVRLSGCRISFNGRYNRGNTYVPGGELPPADRPDGFGIETSRGPILIEDTWCEGNLGDGLDCKAMNTTIRRCFVANNSCDGVKLWGKGSRIENTVIYGRGGGAQPPGPWACIVLDVIGSGGSYEIVNCSIDDTWGGSYLLSGLYDRPRTRVRVTMRNTIWRGVGENSPLFFSARTRLTMDHNLFHLPATGHVIEQGLGPKARLTDAAGLAARFGDTNRTGDPLYADPRFGTIGDYHLLPGSPALGAGSAVLAPPDDIDAAPRGSPIDLGAFQQSGR